MTQQCIQSLEHSLYSNVTIVCIDNDSDVQATELMYKGKSYPLFDNVFRESVFENNSQQEKTTQ